MNNGETVLGVAVGTLLVAIGADLFITQGSQYFWSQQYPAAAHHIGSPFWAGFGVASIAVGIFALAVVIRSMEKVE